MRRLMLAVIALATTFGAQATGPVPAAYQVAAHSYDSYCAQATSQMAQTDLMNAKLIDPNKVDDKKTEILLLAKKPLFKDMWQAIYHLVLHQKEGKSLSVIVVTTSYYGECPGDSVKTYVISNELGDLPSQKFFAEPKDEKSD